MDTCPLYLLSGDYAHHARTFKPCKLRHGAAYCQLVERQFLVVCLFGLHYAGHRTYALSIGLCGHSQSGHAQHTYLHLQMQAVEECIAAVGKLVPGDNMLTLLGFLLHNLFVCFNWLFPQYRSFSYSIKRMASTSKENLSAFHNGEK